MVIMSSSQQINLNEYCNIVLTNIDKLNIYVIDEVLELIQSSQIIYFENLFKFIKDYHNLHNRLPDANLLEIQFPGIFIKNSKPFHKDFIEMFLIELRKDSVINKAYMALQNRDIENATIILNSNLVKCDDTELVIGECYNEYEKLEGMPKGVPLGIAELDAIYKNFSYKTNNFIAAPPKSGKTTTAISVAYEAFVKHGLNVLYITLEVTPSDILSNIYARHAFELGKALNAQNIKKVILEDDEKKLFKQTEEHLKEMSDKGEIGKFSVLGVGDFGSISPASIYQKLEKKYDDFGGKIDVVILDHINEFGYYNFPGLKDKFDKINAYIKWWTDLCLAFKGKGFILITLMQINRSGLSLMQKNKALDFTILAEANQAERSAHTITVLYADNNMLLSNTIKVFSLKNRNGRGLTTTTEDGSITTYINAAVYVVGSKSFSSLLCNQNKELLKEDNSIEKLDLFNS